MRPVLLLSTTLSVFAILVGVAGSGPSQSSPRAAALLATTSATTSATVAPLPAAPQSGARIAAQPDSGTLLSYDDAAVRVSPDGAYRLHPVRLSEAHALHAIATRELLIKAPDGKQLRFEYSRHIEHPDGSWTWLGKAADGSEAILTFGERAVFASIPYGAQAPLRVTMLGGQAWLVETDRNKVAAGENSAARPSRPDYLIPPRVKSASVQAAGASAQALAVSAKPVIDLVLGYTAGFAAALGGQSQALTRLDFLVQVTNQAYANSQIVAEARLVRAVQVDYADNTDNNVALEELSGYREGRTIAVPAGLQPLRAARDQYGADLVSLVRKFSTPENSGCGVAWLIGGGQVGFNVTDAGFGYSVVSDGYDVDETNNRSYFCRDETLAHELGHNMGSQHDRATATTTGVLGYGVFPYSFGYKYSDATNKFYTIMAYGDSGTTAYRVFSNPRISTCGGMPCGVADEADNARSMEQTMPTVAQFRNTVVPMVAKVVRTDVNGDGRSDIVWRNQGTQQFSYWLMNGAALTGSAGFFMDGGYAVAGTGDFNGDGLADVLWKNSTARYLIIWQSNGSTYTQREIGGYLASQELVGVGDFNADGRSDLLWRNATAGTLFYWAMNGNALTVSASSPMPSWFQMLGTGDFNGDGYRDLVYADDTRVNFYLGGAGGFMGRFVNGRPGGWSLVGTGDANGDGKDDLYWRNNSSGLLSYWQMDGAAIVANPAFSSPVAQTVSAIGDYNGDGRADLLLTDSSSRTLLMRLASGSSYVQSTVGTFPAGWVAQP